MHTLTLKKVISFLLLLLLLLFTCISKLCRPVFNIIYNMCNLFFLPSSSSSLFESRSLPLETQDSPHQISFLLHAVRETWQLSAKFSHVNSCYFIFFNVCTCICCECINY